MCFPVSFSVDFVVKRFHRPVWFSPLIFPLLCLLPILLSSVGLPEENKAGYKDSDVLTHAHKLERPLFIVHGTADDNVLFCHAVKVISACCGAIAIAIAICCCAVTIACVALFLVRYLLSSDSSLLC